MATTPAATPNSHSHTESGAYALGAAVRAEGMIGVKKKRSSEYRLCCQGVVFYGFSRADGR